MTEYRGDGLRAQRIKDARNIEIEDREIQKKKLSDNMEVKQIADKFSATYDAVAGEISAATVGLVTIDEMKRTQERVMQERERKLVQMQQDRKNQEKDKLKAKELKKAKEKKKLKALSFNPDEDEEEDDEDGGLGKGELKAVIKDMKEKRKSSEEDVTSPEVKKKRFGMNPDVETKFLPDRDRDEEESLLREKLRCEWERRQKEVKEEEVQIIYSYWDGSGHKKIISMRKGDTIYMFLCKVLDNIRNEFPELKTVSGDQLMFVKEDLIIPQTNSFYDFIVSRARGKSGPLFNFELKEEEVADEGVHTGKVILRQWYERNKHIFPASRWEPYDPTKQYSTHVPPNPFNDFRVVDPSEPEDSSGGSILQKLASGVGGGAGGCRTECKCSKSSICEMHYKTTNR